MARLHGCGTARTAALYATACQRAEAAGFHMVCNRRLGNREARMSSELYACVRAAEFPAQALLRLRTDLQAQPVAVLDGPALQEAVCSLNRHAVRRGAVLGMIRLEAEGLSGLRL